LALFNYFVIRSDTKLKIKNRRVPYSAWHAFEFNWVGCKTKNQRSLYL